MTRLSRFGDLVDGNSRTFGSSIKDEDATEYFAISTYLKLKKENRVGKNLPYFFSTFLFRLVRGS